MYITTYDDGPAKTVETAPLQLRADAHRMGGDHYQIEATYPANASNASLLKKMMHAMLAERFGLMVHHEPNEVSGYALVVAKNGPKLEKSTATDPRMSTNLGRILSFCR
jgi:uncharacterized protein (TIGR03435 family)